MSFARKCLVSMTLLSTTAFAADPALPPRPQLEAQVAEQARALRHALPASAEPKLRQVVQAVIVDLDRDGAADPVRVANTHARRVWGDPHVMEAMVTLVLFEVSQHQEKVVDKATSGLKDTLKTQVRTAAPQTQPAAPAGAPVVKETAGDARLRPNAPVPPVNDPHATGKMAAMNMQFLVLEQRTRQLERMYTTISNVLKTRHDTVKNSIGNIR